jgi:hypothetical protein
MAEELASLPVAPAGGGGLEIHFDREGHKGREGHEGLIKLRYIIHRWDAGDWLGERVRNIGYKTNNCLFSCFSSHPSRPSRLFFGSSLK